VLITHSKSFKRGSRKRTIGKQLKLGPVSLKFVTVAFLAIAALFYLAQSAQTSSFKYKIMDLEDQKGKIQTDVKQLEVESARLKSLNEIKTNAAAMGMELSE